MQRVSSRRPAHSVSIHQSVTDSPVPTATLQGVAIARQPILDRSRAVYGYELLYRGLDAGASRINGTDASASVIDTGFFLHGIEALTRGRKAFVNFTRDALLRGYCDVLPPAHTVIEILEDVELDDEIIARCRELKMRGFMIALDDVVHHGRGEKLHDVVDVVKVDVLDSSPSEWQRIRRSFARSGALLLAEKVEDEGVYGATRELGFQLFQGYFFSHPVVLHSRAVPVSQLARLRILHEINRPEIDLNEIAVIISTDPSLSYRLLTLVNSAALGLRHRVTSIQRAALTLGTSGLRKWTSIVVLRALADSKPTELLVSSLVRAHLCEQIARRTALVSRASEMFIMGLFSLLDALLDRPLEQALANLPLASDIKSALLGEPSELRSLLELVCAYERGDWATVMTNATLLEVDVSSVAYAYERTIARVDAILE